MESLGFLLSGDEGRCPSSLPQTSQRLLQAVDCRQRSSAEASSGFCFVFLALRDRCLLLAVDGGGGEGGRCTTRFELSAFFQFANRHGLPALLKDGYRTFTGIDEVTAKNVEACKTLCDITKTSLGGQLCWQCCDVWGNGLALLRFLCTSRRRRAFCVRRSGPNGLGKLIVTSFSKKYVTNDTASILHELEVQHPAAKLLVMAAEMQKQEMGGGCGFLLVIAGQLLTHVGMNFEKESRCASKRRAMRLCWRVLFSTVCEALALLTG